jgi:hypothetical protein
MLGFTLTGARRYFDSRQKEKRESLLRQQDEDLSMGLPDWLIERFSPRRWMIGSSYFDNCSLTLAFYTLSDLSARRKKASGGYMLTGRMKMKPLTKGG